MDHPDVNRGEEAATKFREINEAYRILKDRNPEQEEKSNKQQPHYEGLAEEEVFRKIFGFYYHQDQKAYYRQENVKKKEQYEEYLRSRTIKNEQKQEEFSKVKVNRHYQERSYSKTNHEQLQLMLLGIGCFGFTFGCYLVFRKPQDIQQRVLGEEQISKIRTATMARHMKDIDNVKQMYSDQNDRILKFDPNTEAMDLLLKFTIFPDLEFYCVDPTLFYENEKDFIKGVDFIKYPIKKTQLQYKISHVLEAERCLQNIFVPVEHVLQELDEKGRYNPPGIFMQFYGYLYFEIRNKPINQQNLIEADQYISLFDLFFKYKSPIPLYYNDYTEFQLHQTGDQWVKNGQFSQKSIPKIYLTGNVKALFMQRPKPGTPDERRYSFTWADYYQKLI